MTMRARQIKKQLTRLRKTLSREDGWAGSVLLVFGIVIVLLAGVQGTSSFIAWNAAQVAAQSAYTVARSYESTPEAGQAAAQQLLGSLSGSIVDPTVTVTRTAETVTVTVTGHAKDVLPGIQLAPVTYTHTGPVERWVPAP